MAVFLSNPTETQWFVFRVVLALAAAGVGAVLPGVINVPAGRVIRAGGALALFVIVYWYNPPKLVSVPPGNGTTVSTAPCPMGNIDVEGFQTSNTTEAVETYGKTPCIKIENLKVTGGKGLVTHQEQFQNNPPAQAQTKPQ